MVETADTSYDFNVPDEFNDTNLCREIHGNEERNEFHRVDPNDP
jgi:hypothetical protein